MLLLYKWICSIVKRGLGGAIIHGNYAGVTDGIHPKKIIDKNITLIDDDTL